MTAPTTRPSLTRRLLTDRRLHRDIVRTLLTPHPPEHYVRSLGVDWADDPTGTTVVTVDRPVEDVTVLTLRLPAGVEHRELPGGLYLHISQIEVNGDNPSILYEVAFGHLRELYLDAHPEYAWDSSRKVVARFRGANCASVFVPLCRT